MSPSRVPALSRCAVRPAKECHLSGRRRSFFMAEVQGNLKSKLPHPPGRTSRAVYSLVQDLRLRRSAEADVKRTNNKVKHRPLHQKQNTREGAARMRCQCFSIPLILQLLRSSSSVQQNASHEKHVEKHEMIRKNKPTKKTARCYEASIRKMPPYVSTSANYGARVCIREKKSIEIQTCPQSS